MKIPVDKTCPVCHLWNCGYIECKNCSYYHTTICSNFKEDCRCEESDFYQYIKKLEAILINIQSENYNLHQMVTRLNDQLDYFKEL